MWSLCFHLMSTFAHTSSHNSQSVTIQTHWILSCFCKPLHWFAISLPWSGVQPTFFLSDFISLELHWLLLFFSGILQTHCASPSQLKCCLLLECTAGAHTHTYSISFPLFFLIALVTTWYSMHFFKICLPPPTRMSAAWGGGGIFLCSLLYPQSLEQHLELGRCLINVYCINEWIHY